MDVRGKRKVAGRLILGIGQIHPVHRGKFTRSLSRKIADAQAWIFTLTDFLHRTWGVREFGQEGFSAAGEDPVHARLDPQILGDLKAELAREGSVRSLLRQVAGRWRKALRRKDAAEVRHTATVLNGLTILQSLYSDVSLFPIEQVDVHGRLGEGIGYLHDEIAALEASSSYRGFQAKGGKGLTQEEYDAATRRMTLGKQFHALLNHPERDRSIFREVVEHAEGRAMTVFVLGQAHRGRQLKLAKEYLPADALYVWITPPQLWWWRSMVRRALWILGIAAVTFALLIQRWGLPS